MAAPETIRFVGGAGAVLAATVSVPDQGAATAWAVVSHCFSCHRNYKAPVNIARALNTAGFGVLRFDFTGLGESEGRFEETTFSTQLADLEAACRHLAANFGHPDLLVGHSLGGLASVFVASRIEWVRCVATVSAPFRVQGLTRLFSDEQRAVWREDPDRVLQTLVMGHEMPFTARFLADLDQHDTPRALAALKVPIMICHSPADQTTPLSNAEELFAAANQPKSFLSLGDSDHLVSKREDGEMIGRVLANWTRRYLG